MCLGKWLYGLPIELAWVWRWWLARREGERTIRQAMELRQARATTNTIPMPRILPAQVTACETVQGQAASGR